MTRKQDDYSQEDIKGYTFVNFEEEPAVFRADSVNDFEIKNFDEHDIHKDLSKHKHNIREERILSEKNNFEIATIVSKHRGLLKDREDERQRLIEAEVVRRVAELKEQAMHDGFEEGKKKGEELVINELKNSVEEKLTHLTELVNQVLATRDEILVEQKKQMFTMIRNLTKWVILRELSDDGEYLSRLLEKLIVELQSKSNILIQVSKAQFDAVPEALEVIQNKIGRLDNIRVEVDYDIQEHGIIVSSDNGIIKGTLEQQFANLDKLFEAVGVRSESEE
jgi:flagellar assembly protein FliH